MPIILENIWENMVLLIGGYELKGDNTLEVQIAEDDTRAKVLKQIELLDIFSGVKVRNER